MDTPSSSPAPELGQSLRSPQLQQEFFREHRRRFRDDSSNDSSPSAPLSPCSSPRSSPSPSPGSNSAQPLSSPSPGVSPSPSLSPGPCPGPSLAVMAELQTKPSSSLKPIRRPKGKTTIFCGRGSDQRPQPINDQRNGAESKS